MTPTRRAFLASASRSAAGAIASATLLSCAASPRRAATVAPTTAAAPRAFLRPPPGRVLFIAGQGGDQIAGYLDHMPVRPAGFSLYCSVARDPGCDGLSRDCAPAALADSVLHLSVTWVDDDLDFSKGRNNALITTGAFDEHIDRLSYWCAAQPRPILLRIGYEFDRGVPFPNYHYDPAYFPQAFRRIVDRLRAAGAHNVATCLASTNAPRFSPALTAASFNRFYPGDDYVDWLGCSMWDPADVDHVILAEARKRNKPVLLAETTPVKFNIGDRAYYPYYLGLAQDAPAQAIWDRWHGPMVDFIRANIDVIAGWHYIAADWSADPMWGRVFFFANCDARPWADPEFLDLWARHVSAGPPFLHASPTLFRDLGRS